MSEYQLLSLLQHGSSREHSACIQESLKQGSKQEPVRTKQQIFKRLIFQIFRKIKRGQKTFKKKNSLNQDQIFEGFGNNINRASLACFTQFCQAISQNNQLMNLDLSGCTINLYYAIELADAIQINESLISLSLANCHLNAFSLSCIFKALVDHPTIKIISFFNNQNFNQNVVDDFCSYVLKGKNHIREINLSHCCIDEFPLQTLLRNIRHLKSLKRLKLKLMVFNTESILALGNAMIYYTGQQCLDSLDISNNYIKSTGIALLRKALMLSVRNININELNLQGNHIDNEGVEDLEDIIESLNNPYEINLSNNKITQFKGQKVLQKKIFKLNLSYNKFSGFPNNFFHNVMSLNLVGNQIDVKGAYELSQIIVSKKVQWVELILSDNQIQTKGFISIVYALRENKTIFRLCVANNHLDGEAILVYLFNHEMIKLRYLDLSSNKFRYELVYALINLINQCDIRCLLLSSLIEDEDDDKEFKELFQINSNNLRELDFSNNRRMISPILQSLSIQFSAIEYLNLSKCHIETLIDIQNFAKFIQKSQNLHTLNFSNNNIGTIDQDYFILFSQALGKSSSLRFLNLSKNKLGETIYGFLLLELQLCLTLEYLDLSDNNIGDKQSKQFFKLVTNSNLRSLNLNNNRISILTMEAIEAAIIDNKQFCELSIANQRFTADDLLCTSNLLNKSKYLKSLNLSGNIAIDKVDNFFFFQQNPRVESLSINKILFNEKDIHDLEIVIQNNEKNLRIIEFQNILLSKKYLTQFLGFLRKVRNLNALIMDYQVFVDKSTYDLLVILVPKLKYLKYLSIKKSQLSLYFFEFLNKLLLDVHKLQELDLSDNVLNEEWLQQFSITLGQTQCLDNLKLQNCKLDDKLIMILYTGLVQNDSIHFLDVSENFLSYKSFLYFTQLYSSKKKVCQLTHLICEQNKICSLIIQEFMAQVDPSIFPKLNYLDLSKNPQLQLIFKSFANSLQIGQIYQNVLVLNLEKCNLNDDYADNLNIMIQKAYSLQELNLHGNKLSDESFKSIFNALFGSNSYLKKINLSKNLISDQFFLNSQTNKNCKLKFLQLLILDHNEITGVSCQGIINLLKYNPKLFIFNYWKDITEELAYLIVRALVQISQDNQIGRGSVPYYFSVFHLTHSSITDEFCQYFSNEYHLFPFLKVINFDFNQKITMFGKLYMYINIFQDNFFHYDLQEFYFNDQRNYPMVFDDGILRYILIKTKNRLQNPIKSLEINNISKSYGNINNNNQTQENIKWGMFGKMIVDIINRNLNFLSEYDQSEFKISTKFISLIKKRNKQLKTWSVVHSSFDILLFSLCFYFVFAHENPNWNDYKQRYIQGYCDQKLCLPYDNLIITYIASSIALFIVSAIISSINLSLTIYFRINAEPDYQIMTPKVRQFLKSKTPHRYEVFLFFFATISQMAYFFEFSLITQFWIQYNFASGDQNLKDSSQRSYIYYCVSLALVTLKLLFQMALNFKALKLFFQDHQNNHASYLNAFWRKAQYDFNYISEYFLSNFCPQSGVTLCGGYFSYRQVFEIIQAFCIELVLICLYGICIADARILSQYLGYQNVISISEIFVYIGLLKSILKFLINLTIGITSRPPQIKLQEFNQALLLRRYKEMNNQQKLYFNQPQNGLLERRPKLVSSRSIDKTDPRNVKVQDDDPQWNDESVDEYQVINDDSFLNKGSMPSKLYEKKSISYIKSKFKID